MAKRQKDSRDSQLGDYAFSVKLGEVGLAHLMRLQQLLADQVFDEERLTKGEVIRRALRNTLLAELGRRADVGNENDPFTIEYYQEACGLLGIEGGRNKEQEQQLQAARADLRKLSPGKKRKGNQR